MKVNELMVGDLVYIHEPECKGHRIDAIDELDGQVGADGEVYDECDIRPIPLNEEILEKNGFTKDYRYDGNQIEYDLDGFPITVVYNKNKKEWHAGTYMCGRESDWVERQFDCRFLHQLQHLLRMAGVEKEIEP